MNKKPFYVVVPVLAVLCLAGVSAFAAPELSKPELTRLVMSQVKQKDNKQIVNFLDQLIKKDPAAFATLLLECKLADVYNPNVVYIGVKNVDDVMVVTRVEDSDVGNFYRITFRKGTRYSNADSATPPTHEGYTTLFEL